MKISLHATPVKSFQHTVLTFWLNFSGFKLNTQKRYLKKKRNRNNQGTEKYAPFYYIGKILM